MALLRSLATTAALFASWGAFAINVVDEGISHRVGMQGEREVPGPRAAKINAGQDVFHYVQYSGLPAGRVEQRCVASDSPGGEALVDETEAHDDWESEGYSICGYSTSRRGFESGTYYFTQYLNGRKVSEQSIAIEAHSRGMSVNKQWKYALGGLCAVILAVGWIRKRMKGEKETVAAPVPERSALVIGSKAERPAPPAQAAAPAEDWPARYRAFKERLGRDPASRIEKPEDVLPIAKAARAAGDAQAAVCAVRGFDKAHPGHSLIPDVYLFSARLMAEDLGNTAMAKKILEHVLAKYPGHYLAGEARKYLQGLPQPA